ncbi:MAG: YhhA family cyclophane-containing RiPP [Pseudomonadota bacterium]
MQVEKVAVGAGDEVALGSAALERLIAEVRTGEVRSSAGAYNRTYNRHNR